MASRQRRTIAITPLRLAFALVVVAAIAAAVTLVVARRATTTSQPDTTTATTSRPAGSADSATTTPSAVRAGSTSTTAGTSPAAALQVVGFSPADGTANVAGSGPIQVTFSAALASGTPAPTISPDVPGSWKQTAADTLTFTPTEPFVPLSAVTVTVPAGSAGIRAASGAELSRPAQDGFRIEDGSILRLQQLLSLLDYSPLSWTPTGTPISPGDVTAQLQATYAPPAGTFAWLQHGWPAQLTSLWEPGVYNVMTRGLVMEFQADHGLIVNGHLGPGLWNDLVGAIGSGGHNTGGYDYALGNQAKPESLTIWHDGTVVLHVPANTGIAQAPTADGTFPVFARYRNEVMHGTNPGGSKYADPVQFVAYFNGGDAVHFIPRANYGIPQSLGCIELSLADAARAWPYLAYGTLVTVVN